MSVPSGFTYTTTVISSDPTDNPPEEVESVQTFTVASTGLYTTIQSAITAAALIEGPHDIVVFAGTYAGFTLANNIHIIGTGVEGAVIISSAITVPVQVTDSTLLRLQINAPVNVSGKCGLLSCSLGDADSPMAAGLRVLTASAVVTGSGVSIHAVTAIEMHESSIVRLSNSSVNGAIETL